ncbi:MAG TPA: acyltransferase [Chitinophagaceae bacterium]|nr:acyltransferase [Chitinophagaceae bacterium]
MAKLNKSFSGNYFENLDGLRFFCFLFVFFVHSFHTENPDIKNSPLYHFFKVTLFGNGFLGVNFFFVLSGFLITYLLIKEKKGSNGIQVGKFWMRRILRIWPLYFACVFYGFVIFPYTKILAGGVPQETANPWYYIGFISNFDYINKGMPDATGLGVLWSVAIEEQFYLAWPVILSFFPLKRFWIPLLTILTGSLIFRALNDVPILHTMHTLSCIGDMALGGLGAWLILESASFKNRISNLPRWFILFVYLAFAFIFLFRDEYLLSSYGLRVFERLIISVVILLIILEQCFARYSFYKMGNFRIVSRLGLVTYGLYCIHFIIIPLTVGLTKKLGMNSQVWQVVFLETSLSLLTTIGISLLSYRYFEAPFLKLKEKFSFKTNLSSMKNKSSW